MKRINNLVVCTALILATAASVIGCSNHVKSNNTSEYSGYLWNGGDRSKHLAAHTPELDEIPREYLKYINLNPDDYNIDTLSQYSSSNLGAQAAYHSHVYRKDEDVDSGFYIWVLDNGETRDTRFVDDLTPALQDYFSEKIHKNYPDVRVITSIFFHNMPSKEWSVAEGIDTLLNSEDDYRIYLSLIYGPDVKMTEADVESIKNEFLNLNSLDALFYRNSNPDTVSVNELNKSESEFSFYEHN